MNQHTASAMPLQVLLLLLLLLVQPVCVSYRRLGHVDSSHQQHLESEEDFFISEDTTFSAFLRYSFLKHHTDCLQRLVGTTGYCASRAQRIVLIRIRMTF